MSRPSPSRASASTGERTQSTACSMWSGFSLISPAGDRGCPLFRLSGGHPGGLSLSASARTLVMSEAGWACSDRGRSSMRRPVRSAAKTSWASGLERTSSISARGTASTSRRRPEYTGCNRGGVFLRRRRFVSARVTCSTCAASCFRSELRRTSVWPRSGTTMWSILISEFCPRSQSTGSTPSYRPHGQDPSIGVVLYDMT